MRVLDAFRPRGATWSGQVISSPPGPSGGPSKTHLLPGGGVPRVHRARSPVLPRRPRFATPRSEKPSARWAKDVSSVVGVHWPLDHCEHPSSLLAHTSSTLHYMRSSIRYCSVLCHKSDSNGCGFAGWLRWTAIQFLTATCHDQLCDWSEAADMMSRAVFHRSFQQHWQQLLHSLRHETLSTHRFTDFIQQFSSRAANSPCDTTHVSKSTTR